jgi:hypothetical protein
VLALKGCWRPWRIQCRLWTTAALADKAQGHGCARIGWSVLDWNQSAIRFYQSLGAVPMDEWIGYRLSGEALAALGSTDHQVE